MGYLYQSRHVIAAWALNWSFRLGALYWSDGIALVCCLFGAAGFWAVGVRTFNYEGPDKGSNRQVEGVDFNTKDSAINQIGRAS